MLLLLDHLPPLAWCVAPGHLVDTWGLLDRIKGKKCPSSIEIGGIYAFGLICLGPFPALGFFNQFHLLKGKIKEREHFKVESKGKKKIKRRLFGEFPGSPVVRTGLSIVTFTLKVTSALLIPGQGTKIPIANK